MFQVFQEKQDQIMQAIEESHKLIVCTLKTNLFRGIELISIIFCMKAKLLKLVVNKIRTKLRIIVFIKYDMEYLAGTNEIEHL